MIGRARSRGMKVSMTDKDVRVRLSHLLRECSVGAIVRDGARQSDGSAGHPYLGPSGERSHGSGDSLRGEGTERPRYRKVTLQPAACDRARRDHPWMDPGPEVPYLDALFEVRVAAPGAVASTERGAKLLGTRRRKRCMQWATRAGALGSRSRRGLSGGCALARLGPRCCSRS